MKRTILLLLLTASILYGSDYKKSAIVYYGEDISYPSIGIHDYIILQPKHVDTSTPGFSLYKNKIYAYVSIGEIDKNLQCYEKVQKEWIASKNTMWQSDVLDIKNKAYREFIFKHQIDPLIQRGFQNFFFDTLDSYEFYTQNSTQRKKNQEALATFILEFHKRYPTAKLIVNRGFDIMDKIHDAVTAVLFESYFHGLQNDIKHPYKEISNNDRAWLDNKLKKVRAYNKDIICIDYLPPKQLFDKKGKNLVKRLHAKGFIPYVSTKNLDIYGISAKNPLKREVLVLIDEHRLDRTLLEAHQYGATVLEYLGYKEVLYDISAHSFPPVETLHRYSGVVIWLQDYIPPARIKKYLAWLQKVKKEKIKLLFINNFGANFTKEELSFLGISFSKTSANKVKILKRDPQLMDFEIDPPMSSKSLVIEVKNAKEVLSYLYSDGSISTPAALTAWGGYFVDEGYMVNIENNNIWVANPFLLFEQSLSLAKIPVADVTTQSGKRLLFTHIDGDGIANKVEGNFGKYSIDSIYNHILNVYKIPHSVSFIGSELDPNGRYPKIVDELRNMAKKILALPNVEGATHTYTHPFFWGKIKNDNLPPQYRIDIKGYDFSLKKELYDPLVTLNTQLSPPDKQPKAKTVFWSGDCAPRLNALKFVYDHKLLNINGGNTIISNEHPWLSNISPLGLERKNFTQIYTGEQNENVFTNDWLGPFWGFKRVIQTYKRTNTPRRFKPIDIYYHFYSGSKQASLKALKEVFDWATRQDVIPVFTSEYIPRVMEFYNYALAKNDDGSYNFCGLKQLDTIRMDQTKNKEPFSPSSTVIGRKKFQNHLYYTLFTKQNQNNSCIKFDFSNNNTQAPYLIAANAVVENFEKNATTYTYSLKAHVPLQADFFLPQKCEAFLFPKPKKRLLSQRTLHITYEKSKTAKVSIQCLEN